MDLIINLNGEKITTKIPGPGFSVKMVVEMINGEVETNMRMKRDPTLANILLRLQHLDGTNSHHIFNGRHHSFQIDIDGAGQVVQVLPQPIHPAGQPIHPAIGVGGGGQPLPGL